MTALFYLKKYLFLKKTLPPSEGQRLQTIEGLNKIKS
tara:strand:+ start:239 stop:349 length:111 start_codon:yes stop_codon:yes gene_type:complete